MRQQILIYALSSPGHLWGRAPKVPVDGRRRWEEHEREKAELRINANNDSPSRWDRLNADAGPGTDVALEAF